MVNERFQLSKGLHCSGGRQITNTHANRSFVDGAREGIDKNALRALGWVTGWMLVPFTKTRNAEGGPDLSGKSMGSVLDVLFEMPSR